MPVKSSVLTVIRTVVLFVPLGYLFSLIGLDYFWFTYPVTDTLTAIVGLLMSIAFFKTPYPKNNLSAPQDVTAQENAK